MGTNEFYRLLDEAIAGRAVRLSSTRQSGPIVEIALRVCWSAGCGRTSSFWPAGSVAREDLANDDVRALHKQGMVIGSHGMNHRSWRRMDTATAAAELVAARDQLAEVVATPVTTAACPLGRYDRTLLGRLRRLGYERVYTSDRRTATVEAWLQPRYSARRPDTPASLRATADAAGRAPQGATERGGSRPSDCADAPRAVAPVSATLRSARRSAQRDARLSANARLSATLG